MVALGAFLLAQAAKRISDAEKKNKKDDDKKVVFEKEDTYV